MVKPTRVNGSVRHRMLATLAVETNLLVVQHLVGLFAGNLVRSSDSSISTGNVFATVAGKILLAPVAVAMVEVSVTPKQDATRAVAAATVQRVPLNPIPAPEWPGCPTRILEL